MKCRELAEVFDRLRVGIAEFGGSAAGFEALATLLAVKPDQTATQLAKALSLAGQSETSEHSGISEARRTLDVLLDMISGFAKPAVSTDLKAIHVALERHEGSQVDMLVSALSASSAKKSRSKPATEPANEEVVRRYFVALEDRLGDDAGFTAIFKTLESDSQVQKAEAVALAKRFAFASVSTRAAAFKKIWSRHQSLMISRAKSAATAGRIAG